MKDTEAIDKVLAAFVDDFPPDELSIGELDRLYSEAISEGLLTEQEVNESFERFLKREVRAEPDSAGLVLADAECPTVGDVVRRYAERLGKTLADVAVDLGIDVEQARELEACTLHVDPERLMELSRRLVVKFNGLSPGRTHRFLQAARVTEGLRSTSGPVLKAARKLST